MSLAKLEWDEVLLSAHYVTSHYINGRKSTLETVIERIYFVQPKQRRTDVTCSALLSQLLAKLVDAEKVKASDVSSDMEALKDGICKTLIDDKALVVFDHTELLDKPEEVNDFRVFLKMLFQRTRNVRVLLTAHRSLVISSIGGQVEQCFPLGPLVFHDSVRLFAYLCPHLHTREERKGLYDRLVIFDGEQARLGINDEGLDARTQRILSALGDGFPARIEKAAYEISIDMLRELGN